MCALWVFRLFKREEKTIEKFGLKCVSKTTAIRTRGIFEQSHHYRLKMAYCYDIYHFLKINMSLSNDLYFILNPESKECSFEDVIDVYDVLQRNLTLKLHHLAKPYFEIINFQQKANMIDICNFGVWYITVNLKMSKNSIK